ncbi:Uncharacterised protein [Candidatus Tiddalikarchaeum anstoanum]|nr:Uncharacterised protein [Candidatus Tiddalikarchaeum anstoanum]
MTWTHLLSLCVKSKNHVKVLEELYSSSKNAKQIKTVNYKTFNRVVNNYITLGIVSKDKLIYSLTNKGKLLAYLVLGRFESIKPEINTKSIVDTKDVYIERSEVIKQILYNIERKKHTLILGVSGSGKTSLLKYLQTNYLKKSVYSTTKPVKQLLESITDSEKINCKKNTTTNALLELIKVSKPNCVLLIDELELAPNQSIRTLKELQRIGLVLVCAGQRIKQGLTIDDTIKLRILTNEEVSNLVSSLLGQEFNNLDEIKQLALNSTDHNPENVKRVCEQAKTLKDLNEENTLTVQVKPTNKRINILSQEGLVSIGFLLITMRYLFYGQGQYELGYILSAVAYLIFFLFRRHKSK